jgi:hypothetical protein
MSSEPLKLYEVAYLLQRTLNQARRLVERGELVPLPSTGKLLRFDPAAVERLLLDPLAIQRLRELERGDLVVDRPDSPSAVPAPLSRPRSARSQR